MDRRQLLDRAARNGDERVLLAHILDKCEQSRNRNIPSATDFLSPAEQRSAQDLLHAAAIHDGCAFCGGFERAERRMLLFLPDWQEEADESEYMTALRCTYRKEDTLTHRDFLGSLMAQGVTREKLGDIVVRHEDLLFDDGRPEQAARRRGGSIVPDDDVFILRTGPQHGGSAAETS